ncbi:hypothetical protein [Stenotrophomonas sp.]|uniref:hypothetical protein n=1 Tax=Stenotrophomonas sp. TaxID=69392 RepID=UPI00289A6FAF|nr:hypothetical protein [Stenotrophomonas sp.]
MIKVSQINSAVEIGRLSSIDVASFAVGRSSSANALDVDQCRSLCSGLDCVYAVYPIGGFDDIGFCRELFEELKPRYLEFTVVDPEKMELSAAQLRALSTLDVGKIANELFVLKDDLSLLSRISQMDALVQAGVELFQIEVESLADPEARIARRSHARIAQFLFRYPALIGDSFALGVDLPDVNQVGYNLTLTNESARAYDLSQQHYALSSVISIVKGLRAARIRRA